MFDEQFEKLGMTDRENFRRLVNWLLAHTFLTVEEYDFTEGISRVNRDYLFVERNFALFSDYFSFAGFGLERDSNYGVIYLSSSYEGNRARFDKLTTLMVYALRLIYEEEREKLSLQKEIFTTTGDLVHKLITLGVLQKKPANTALHDSLRAIAGFNVIEKIDGAWEDPQTRLLILPTILFIVSNEQISNMYRLTETADGGEEPDEKGEAETVYEETD